MGVFRYAEHVRLRQFQHCIVALAAGSIVSGPTWASAQPVAATGDAVFNIFVRGRNVGSERVDVTTDAEGIVISATGRLVPPVDLTVRTARVAYDTTWQPKDLAVEGMVRGQAFFIRTQFAQGRASNFVLEGGRTRSKDDTIAPRVVVIPANFFGAYEALAIRLSAATPGTDFQVYAAPQGEIRMTLTSVVPERVQVTGAVLNLRRHIVTFHNPSGPVGGEVWADERGRLARATLPISGIDVVREDIASVTARRQTAWRDSDEDIRVPAAGFTLAGTLSRPAPAAGTPVGEKPASPAPRLPAAILVAGDGSNDRDENIAGLPVFGQFASLLADRGFIVVRYDKRGIGQSGGRAESGTVSDYAEDVRAVAKALSERADVDPKRIIVVGHGQGTAVALLAAQREKRVAAVVLANGFASTGADLVLEQQQLTLSKSSLSQSERDDRVALQKRIHAAVLSANGGGWDGVPANVRAAADTAWFRSFLTFDPMNVLTKFRQPVLVIHGELDMQIPVHHADRLAQAANSRKRARTTEVHRLSGVNHILTQAVTGEVAEYSTLADKQVVPEVGDVMTAWVNKVLPAPGAKPGQSQ